MDNIQTLRAWLEQNLGPWMVTMWTCEEDGRSPIEFTAGFFSGRVDNWEVSEGIIRFWAQDSGSNLALVNQAIGEVEEVESEGHRFARFGYVNLATNAVGFMPYVIFTVYQCD